MSDKARQRLEVGLIALLFGAGAGWGTFQWQLSDITAQVKRIDERVAAMYCASIPASQRAACR
jgi:hypothetical protein